jgi:ABC-type lipoprotein export system ATPase subunit
MAVMLLMSNIKKLTLSGFRAYLYEQDIEFGAGCSVAIFAPNGNGKSSLVDATEFVFSKTGTVARLGEKRSGIQAGKDALVHHDAEKTKISPFVKVEFVSGRQLTPFLRSATSPEALPTQLSETLEGAKVPFIIRGFELRKFVEGETPSDRYAAISSWFGFSPLLQTQDGLRNLRLDLNRSISDGTVIDQLHRDTQKLTSRTELQWNEGKLVDWFNRTILSKLDSTLSLKSLDEATELSDLIQKRANDEALSANVVLKKSIADQLVDLLGTLEPKKDGFLQSAVTSFEILKDAEKKLDEVKSQSEKAIFAKIWKEAKSVFFDEKIAFESCPVCETLLSDTPSKTRDALKVKINLNLGEIEAFHNAEAALKTASQSAIQKVRQVKQSLTSLCSLLKQASHTEISLPLEQVSQACEKYDSSSAEIDFSKTLSTLRELQTKFADSDSSSGAKTTWASAKANLETLISLKDRAEHDSKKKSEIQKIHDAVVRYAGTVDIEVKKYVEGLISALTEKINFFYKEIQSGTDRVPKIYLAFPSGEKKIQHQLDLLIDFADNRKNVPPSGYLSDSQVHTLALAIRLAAIGMFNSSFSLIILDDIVTSYDVDRRKAIVDLMANHLSGYQLLVMTHDEQFFRLMDEQLDPSRWKFKRITKLDYSYGPKYADHRVLDEQIQELHTEEQSAANLMRQAEEEWLGRVCREFGVSTRIREINRPYSYQRQELATSLQTFLKDRKMLPPVVTGNQNPFLRSVQKGSVENLGSHFQDDPQLFASVGDERSRWKNFVEFRSQFACSKCNKGRFQRPESVQHPLCNSCSHPFSFAADAEA